MRDAALLVTWELLVTKVVLCSPAVYTSVGNLVVIAGFRRK